MTDDREARNDSSSIEGNYTYRHHVEPGVVPEGESFPIPLRHVYGDRNSPEPWTSFTQFTISNESLLTEMYLNKYIYGLGSGFQKIKQPQDLVICGQKFRLECQKPAQRKEKQQRALEKPKLDNARKLRGIYVMDPEDEEFKETIQKSWNCLWKQLCLVRSRTASTGRLVADPTTENQSMHASQKLANL